MTTPAFFDAVRPLFGGRLKQSQVDGLTALVGATAGLPTPYRAYLLATAQHETAHTMLPVRETLAKTDDQAVSRLESAWRNGKLKTVKTPYWRKDSAGKTWLGRGYVQLTHKVNYERASKLTGVDLVANPNAAMRPDVAAKVLVQGCLVGMFTGKKLADYLDGPKPDYVGARRVVNGTDRAQSIATLARGYEKAFSHLPAAKGPIIDTVDHQGQGMAAALDVAETMLNKHERQDRQELTRFLAVPGQSVDPQTTAWCAGFVNAVLSKTGMVGTGSLMARSFLGWGAPVSNPGPGDVVVIKRGEAPFGHVGLYVGKNQDGTIRVLGGNQSDRVSVANYATKDVLGYRRVLNAPVAGTPTVPRTKPVPVSVPQTQPVPETQPAPKTTPVSLLSRMLATLNAFLRRS